MRKRDLYLDYENGKIYWLYYDTGNMKEVGGKHNGYLCFWYEGKRVLCHRFLFEKYHNVKLEPNQDVDHIDRNPSNNSIKNLRVVSHQQNMQNRTHQKNSTTKHKNVYLDKQRNKYEVRIRVDGKLEYFGLFEKLEDAIKKRDKEIEILNSQGHIFST